MIKGNNKISQCENMAEFDSGEIIDNIRDF